MLTQLCSFASNSPSLSARRRALESEKETILNRRQACQAANARFDQLEAWCGQVAARLGTLSYREKRLALESLNIVVKVWKRKHTPRYEISATLRLDQFVVPVTNIARGIVCSFRKSVGRTGRFR